jgi:hypothetical protein
MFKNSPFLYQNADRVKFHEVSEEEVIEIYKHVHEKTDYVYQIDEGSVIVKDYISFISSEIVKEEVKKLKEKQAEGVKKAPRL